MEDSPKPPTAEERDRAWKTMGIIFSIIILVDVIVFYRLFKYGGAEDLDHAREQLANPLTGPNAP